MYGKILLIFTFAEWRDRNSINQLSHDVNAVSESETATNSLPRKLTFFILFLFSVATKRRQMVGPSIYNQFFSAYCRSDICRVY